jgi:hypothetical protein
MEGKRTAMTRRVTIEKHIDEFGQRSRARQRLPAWMKVLLPFTALSFEFGATVVLFWAMLEMHALVHVGKQMFSGPGLAFILMFFGSFIAVAPPSLIGGNLLLFAIPPVRRALDENAASIPGASFKKSMRDCTV